jgi:pyruvate formate lyase activating enzyme
MTVRALVLDIKDNSLDDGPGIRSVVFFKGCPLTCAWCHNPESRRRCVELSYDAAECLSSCGACLRLCPQHAIARENPSFVDRAQCDFCFECVRVCPSEAIARVGSEMDVTDVVQRVLRDKPFYEKSGGGVTLSGGEPTLQMESASSLARALKHESVAVLLETCGHFSLERFDALLYPWLDVIYFDLKLHDADEHLRWCGVPNRVILENFAALHARSLGGAVKVLPRIPLIPNVTATQSNLFAFAEFLKNLGVARVRLLPYNPIWADKIAKIGMSPPEDLDPAWEAWMPRDEIRRCEAIFTAAGIGV